MSDQPSAVLVTGAARGIGKAIAEQFASDDEYDIVACLDIDDDVHDVVEEFEGGEGYTVDITDHDRVQKVVEKIETSAHIDAAVNNAAIAEYYWIADLEPDRWDRVLDVNLTGQYNIARAVGPRMFEREHGYMVNISSGAGIRGSISAGVHYSASKGGVLGFTYGLAKQLSPFVHVNCVVPGLIDTTSGEPSEEDERRIQKMRELLPLGRLGQPEEVARVVHFLCGEGASYMTGSVVRVRGGSDLMPNKEYLMPEASDKPI